MAALNLRDLPVLILAEQGNVPEALTILGGEPVWLGWDSSAGRWRSDPYLGSQLDSALRHLLAPALAAIYHRSAGQPVSSHEARA